MADPTAITGVVGAISGLLGASMPFVIDRVRSRRERKEEFSHAVEQQAEYSIANWRALNEALNREIDRLNRDNERLQTENRTLRDENVTLRSVLGRETK